MKTKSKWKHMVYILAIVFLLLIIAYCITIIPESNSNLAKPSEIACSTDNDCPEEETCRREISLVTNNFFGTYNCRMPVEAGNICETWNNCQSGTCSKGKCVE